MTGRVMAIEPGDEGRLVAVVQLDAGAPIRVAYWPELLQQWGADALRAHLVQQAVDQQAAAAAPPPALSQADLIGEAEPAIVCRKGEIGCTDPHLEPPAEAATEAPTEPPAEPATEPPTEPGPATVAP